jgi:hypothetical protein
MMDASSTGGGDDDDENLYKSWEVALVAIGSVLGAALLAIAVLFVVKKQAVGAEKRSLDDESKL